MKQNQRGTAPFPVTAIVSIAILLVTTVFMAGGWAVSGQMTGIIVERNQSDISELKDELHSIDTRLSVIETAVEKTERHLERMANRNE